MQKIQILKTLRVPLIWNQGSMPLKSRMQALHGTLYNAVDSHHFGVQYMDAIV